MVSMIVRPLGLALSLITFDERGLRLVYWLDAIALLRVVWRSLLERCRRCRGRY